MISWKEKDAMPTTLEEAVDEVLSPSFLTGAHSITMDDLRARRERAQGIESMLSYVRRLLQARIDILKDAGLPARDEDVSGVAEELSKSLAHHVKGPEMSSRFVEVELPEALQGLAHEWMNNLTEGTSLDHDRLIATLEEAERGISSKRHQLHDVLKVLSSEVKDRYKSGDASIDSVLNERKS